MKRFNPEQVPLKAQRLVRELNEFYQLHIRYRGGNMNSHDMALINAIVNAGTHLAAHYPVAPAKKAKRG
jgi:hypothetical protein